MVGEQIFPSNGSYNENQNDPLQCVACGIKILFLKAGFVDRLRGDFRAGFVDRLSLSSKKLDINLLCMILSQISF